MPDSSARKPTAEQSLLKKTRESGKTYAFDTEHDPALPADHWFTKTHEGEEFFVVLYTQACLWSLCLGCNLPSRVSPKPVPAESILRQIEHVFGALVPPPRARRLRRITLSNNGSVLDERTFPTEALVRFVSEAGARCPELAVLTLESRADYIDEHELDALAARLRAAGSRAELELAIGFEAFDDEVRNGVFRKGLSLRSFERVVASAVRHGARIKAYFMLKPVAGMSDEAALADITRGLEYLDRLARERGARLSMHLNPTYAAKGTALELALREGRYAPPTLELLRRAALTGEGKRLSLFLGLHDEHLAAAGGSFLRRGDGPLLARLRAFNATQDYGLLREPA